MPRYARDHLPGVTHHILSRFVNEEFRILDDTARHEYLRRLGESLAYTDWRLLAYAVMSNHIHLCALAAELPSEHLIRRVHGGFAHWLNRRQGRLGPVFADRHRTIACEDAAVGALIAYIHNNPVRAGKAADAADSTWSSHRAYVGCEPAPEWLDIPTGLVLSGFAPTAAGRMAFDDFVAARRGQSRDPALSGDSPQAVRRAARAHAAAPLELTTPRLQGGRLLYEMRARRHTPLRADGPIDPTAVIAAVARHTGIDTERLRSRSRQQEIVAARRVALLAWRHLGQRQAEMAAALGIGASAASYLLRQRPEAVPHLDEQARRVAAECGTATTRN